MRIGLWVATVGWVAGVAAGEEAWGWGGEHHDITRAAVEALPADVYRVIAGERAAVIGIYCTFPDVNWACYGRWGGGTGDPQAPRFRDTRREWEVSRYCLWDPVLGKGRFYPHAAPYSYECCPVYFRKAIESLRAGRIEDGVRFLGVLLHYAQDTGSFAHIQPLHRNCKVPKPARISAGDYRPQVLGRDVDEAGEGIRRELEKLVAFTEGQVGPLLAEAGMDIARAREMCQQETMPAAVVEAVRKVLARRREEFGARVLACANACVRVCADILVTAVRLARVSEGGSGVEERGGNLCFNSSFEVDDGDGVPDGWYVEWLDPGDRCGRAVWYRAGSHWQRHVKAGGRSVLVLWAPEKGIEWRQTWPRAVRVRAGEAYRLEAWAEASGRGGRAYVALEFYDGQYQAISRTASADVPVGKGWREMIVEARAPDGAKWMRVVLYSNMADGAVWFDEVRVEAVAGGRGGQS